VTEAERREALEQVAAEVRACTRCRLHEGRTQAVPGEGHPSTEVLLVGEAPGLNEDRQGRPFVGAAGGSLTELLGTVGWARDEVFITNVVKCRPPQNRDPEPDEIAACAPFLRRQVEILDPALIITLGRHSMGRFMPGARIGQVHGTTAAAPEAIGAREALVFAMYHPAAALHQASLRQTLLDDMTGAPRALLEARGRRDVRSIEAVDAVTTGPVTAGCSVEAAMSPDETAVTALSPDPAPAPALSPDPAPAPALLPDHAPGAAAAEASVSETEPSGAPGSRPPAVAAPPPAAVPEPARRPVDAAEGDVQAGPRSAPVLVPDLADPLPPAHDPGQDAAVDQMTLF
jgi:uracil-DNA glycosylase family 4